MSLTGTDLKQIGAVIREEVLASEKRLEDKMVKLEVEIVTNIGNYIQKDVITRLDLHTNVLKQIAANDQQLEGAQKKHAKRISALEDRSGIVPPIELT
jgi:hypothetical protein